MDGAVVVLFCAALVVIAYTVIEGIRTTHLVTMSLGEPAPVEIWMMAAGLTLAVAAPAAAVMKGWLSIPLPSWAAWALLIIGWWLLLSGAFLTCLAACYNLRERRQALREYPGTMEECA